MEMITKEQYESALAKVEALLPQVDDNVPANDPLALELSAMSDIVIAYEKIHFPMLNSDLYDVSSEMDCLYGTVGTPEREQFRREAHAYCGRQDELTTEMHSEIIGAEIPGLDLRVMSVHGALGRGSSLSEALAKYGLTEEEYNSNIERCLCG